jgi:prephenate dehydrogenase
MPPNPDIRLAVFGPGLLGGSLLMDARAMGLREVRVWARREEPLRIVKRRRLASFVSTDPAAVAEGAEIIVLCVPVGGMKALAERLTAARPARKAVFTDVGSVKGMVMREVAPVFRRAGFTFIGSHPMAGSEKGGLAEARPGLYAGAACILTPSPGASRAQVGRLESFWRMLGSHTTTMDAAGHDAVVARVSHLPHVAAVVATLAALKPDPGIARHSAGGLRDTTRVAGGDPDMWCEILMENRACLIPALRDMSRAASKIVSALQKRNRTLLRTQLIAARMLRERAMGEAPRRV